MTTEVIMPKLGMTMQEGTIVRWLKKEGEWVEKGEPILEIETDKVVMEVEASASGILAGISVGPGEVIPVTQTIAYICAPGEEPSPIAERLARVETPVIERPPSLAERALPPRQVKVRASPAARRLARERGVDLSQVKGTGPEGRTTEADVEAFALEKPLPPHVGEVIPLSGVRRIIAERMQRSAREAPHIVLTMEVDMSQAERARSGCSFTALIVQAVAQALRQHPFVNASLQGDEIVLYDEINVGVAVATAEGLIVPVVKAADARGLREIDAEIEGLAKRAREGKLTLEEVTGGTFTISNLGMFGVEDFHAIINPPQAAILAVGAIADRPMVVNGQIVVRLSMKITLSADHRVLDGVAAAEFLRDVKADLERPARVIETEVQAPPC
jgi:pyruvate dehydrogenase E2 component (dihydrolipoamide acetyltransferase)